MKVKVPKDPRFDSIMRGLSFRTVKDDGTMIVYSGIFGFKVDAEMLNMSEREFYAFAKSMQVEGGRKRRVGTAIIVEPERKRRLAVRLSDEEYEDLRKVAEMEGRSVTDLFRELAVVGAAKRRGM